MSIEVHVRIRPNAPTSVWSSAETVLYSTNNPDVRYVYNKVHHGGTGNQTIFQGIEALVHAGFDGKNVTVMAYGQTGSGKTHSMNGTAADPGIVPRTAQLLFDLKRISSGTEIFVYFTEIYNESVKDLLDPQRGDLALHDAPDGGVYFEKKSVLLDSLDGFTKLQATAERNRKYGVTNLNDHSSRSHMILTFEIHRSSRQVSTINLVDLAGSESASRANTDGMLLREGGFINKSLLTLGNVVDAIVDKRTYVPYRDAKLTRILRNCLGGSGMTFILCCINPSMENFEQTVSSLRFTQRAMKIKNDPVMVLNMPPLFAHEYSMGAEQIVQGIDEMSDACYQRGLRDAYFFVNNTVASIVSGFKGRVAEPIQAMVNAQRLLIAHDHAVAIDQIGPLYSRLEELTQQRRHDHDIEEREGKRQRQIEEEIESRITKVTRLEARAKERDAEGDSELANWEYQLYEAQQRRVTQLELLLSAERAARCQLQYKHVICVERIAARWVPLIKSLGPATPPVADKNEAIQRMRQRLEQAREELQDLTVAHDMIKDDLPKMQAMMERADENSVTPVSLSPRPRRNGDAYPAGDNLSDAQIEERIQQLEKEEKSLMSQAIYVARCESARRIRESLTNPRPETPRTSRSVVRLQSATPSCQGKDNKGEEQGQLMGTLDSSPLDAVRRSDYHKRASRQYSPTPRTARTVFQTAGGGLCDDVNVPVGPKRSASPNGENLVDGMRRALGVLRDVRSKLLRPVVGRYMSPAANTGGAADQRTLSPPPRYGCSGSPSGRRTRSSPPINVEESNIGDHVDTFADVSKHRSNAKIQEPVIGIAARRRLEGVPARPNVERALWRLSLSPSSEYNQRSTRSRSRRG